MFNLQQHMIIRGIEADNYSDDFKKILVKSWERDCEYRLGIGVESIPLPLYTTIKNDILYYIAIGKTDVSDIGDGTKEYATCVVEKELAQYEWDRRTRD